MPQNRPATVAKRPSGSAIAKAYDAIVERLTRVLAALAPQPQLQPIPVRVKTGRTPGRR